jgi:hypothetical protein
LALRSRHQIDGVKILASLLSPRWCWFTLKYAYEANLGHSPANHVQSLHQTCDPVTLNLKCSAYGFRFWPCSKFWFSRRCLRRLIAFAGFLYARIGGWRGFG